MKKSILLIVFAFILSLMLISCETETKETKTIDPTNVYGETFTTQTKYKAPVSRTADTTTPFISGVSTTKISPWATGKKGDKLSDFQKEVSTYDHETYSDAPVYDYTKKGN